MYFFDKTLSLCLYTAAAGNIFHNCHQTERVSEWQISFALTTHPGGGGGKVSLILSLSLSLLLAVNVVP